MIKKLKLFEEKKAFQNYNQISYITFALNS